MLMSKDKKFLFVHIQKTGGSSITRALEAKISDLQNFRGMHDHASWARSHLVEEWPNLYKVAFVRNPWDRLVSWYTMIAQQATSLSWYQRLWKKDYNRLWQYVHSNSNSFEEFLYHCTDTIDDIDGKKSFVYSQADYITDEHGELIVDFVGRFENIQHDAHAVFSKLGMGHLNLPHINRSNHDSYQKYYNDQTRRLVAERFAKDIDMFGYEF